MKSERRKKAQSICTKIIAEYLINIQDFYTEHYGIITLTNIEISNDGSYMDIYISTQKNTDTISKELADHAHKITRTIGKQVAFIKVPKIRFRYDHGGENAANIYGTISEIT